MLTFLEVRWPRTKRWCGKDHIFETVKMEGCSCGLGFLTPKQIREKVPLKYVVLPASKKRAKKGRKG